MTKLVHEEHPELYHYTTAAGLKGIVESQQLWATSISYLNDAEEHIGFFDRRLSTILEEPIRAAVAEIASTESGRGHVEAIGGIEKVVEGLRGDLHKSIRSSTLQFNNPFVTSFCSPLSSASPNNGLLSQWRGYGLDGGYAIVFETYPFIQLLEQESQKFSYQSSFWGDVEYFDQNSNPGAAHPETLKFIAIVQEAVRNFILTQKPDAFDPMHEAISILSCLHKHGGFREEAEVRIVAVVTNDELQKVVQESDEKRSRKPVLFLEKKGVLVPYIKLFGHEANGKSNRLPISKVIVGPHPDKLKRQKAVEVLFEQQKIDAQVVVSDIPYLGR